MDCLQGDGGKINQIHMPVESAVETKIAQVGRNTFAVRRVIAEHSDRHASGSLSWRQLRNGIGNVECELIVAPLMIAEERRTDPNSGGLASALEVQNCAPSGERIA